MGNPKWGDHPNSSAVENLQESYYLATYDTTQLLERLKDCIFNIKTHPGKVLEILFILKIIKDISDSSIPKALLDIFDESLNSSSADIEFGLDLWFSDYGRVVITEFLDIIMEYKRADDMPRIIRLLTFDAFHIPSHILMLARKYKWVDLHNTISSRYDIKEEY